MDMTVDALKLRYANVEELVMAMLDVDPAHKKKVVARFKQLRNAHFPPGVNVKTGRFLYDLDATMRVILVFALMNSLVLPTQAMALLQERWTEIRAAIDEAAATLPVVDEKVTVPERPDDGRYIVIATGALDHWAKAEDEEAAVEGSGRLATPGSLSILTQGEMEAAAKGAPAGRLRPGQLVLDLWSITAWTVERIVERGWAKPAQLGVPAP